MRPGERFGVRTTAGGESDPGVPPPAPSAHRLLPLALAVLLGMLGGWLLPLGLIEHAFR